MTSIPLLLMPIITLVGVALTGLAVYFLATSRSRELNVATISSTGHATTSVDRDSGVTKRLEDVFNEHDHSHAPDESIPSQLQIVIGSRKIFYAIDHAKTAKESAGSLRA